MNKFKTLVIIVHPDINNSIANKALKEELKKHPNDFTIHELYDVCSNNLIDVEKEHKLIEQYQNIVFQFPLYWYSSPHLLKKWFDEVFTYGWAYGSSSSKLKGKNFALVITLGGQESYYTKESGGYTLDEILTPYKAIVKFIQGNYCGYHAIFSITRNLSLDDFKNHTQKYIEFLSSFSKNNNNW